MENVTRAFSLPSTYPYVLPFHLSTYKPNLNPA